MRVLVIGKAKTGTTFISKLIETSLAPCDFVMEPKGAEYLPGLYAPEAGRSTVVKVIFEHWDARPNLRRALLADELPLTFDKKILIFRDPRDELVSRLLYIVKPLKDQGKLSSAQLEEWVDLLKRKEADPTSISMMTMVRELDRIFSTTFLLGFKSHLDSFAQVLRQRPRNIFTVHYEDIVDGRWGDLEEYLGFSLIKEVPRDAHIDLTLRSGGYGDWKKVFHPDDKDALMPMIQETMALTGYDDWSLDSGAPLASVAWSDYVLKLAESP